MAHLLKRLSDGIIVHIQILTSGLIGAPQGNLDAKIQLMLEIAERIRVTTTKCIVNSRQCLTLIQ